MARFANRRSITTQIRMMYCSLKREVPPANKIYNMTEDKMKALFAELRAECRDAGLVKQ